MDMPPDIAPPFQPGWVWLVGAGPGDPGLLTLHALHGLRSADTVVYDALVDERVLRLARPGAELVYAGKRGGKPSPQQRDITSEERRVGKKCVRSVRYRSAPCHEKKKNTTINNMNIK